MVIEHLVDVMIKKIFFFFLTVQFLINRNASTAIVGCCDLRPLSIWQNEIVESLQRENRNQPRIEFNLEKDSIRIARPQSSAVSSEHSHETGFVTRLTVCRLRFSMVNPWSQGSYPQKPA